MVKPILNPSLDSALTRVAPAELADRVARVAGGLRDLGADPGAVVTWQSANRDEVAVLYRACWRLGAVAAPLHHQMGEADAARMRAAARPQVTVADLDALPDGSPETSLWGDASARAVVLFTSGSTGAPKGVVHTQASLAYKAAQMAHVHEMTPDDCVLMPAPCAHISGLLNGVTLPGIVPFRTVFMARWNPEDALDLIEAERVTFMVGPPTFFVSMMRSPEFSPERVRSMRLISSGGAGVSQAFVDEAAAAFGARVKRTYGSTEAPSIVTDGHPNGDVQLRVDTNGELLVRGRELFEGYLDGTPGFDDGWYRTGDRATIAADGTVDIVGRIKDIVIRGGENISVAEVEATLEAHPAVQHAVAVGYADELMGERVAVFVVAEHEIDVAAWFAERGVAKFKTPERVEYIDAIPLLATGKPDREALRASALPG